MNYQDIMRALPSEVAEALQKNLDATHIVGDLSPDEAKELIQSAVNLTKLQVLIADDEKRRLVDTLLSFVSTAAVKALFA